MTKSLFASLVAILVLATAFASERAAAQADSATFPRGTRARVKHAVLGPGWHEGKLVELTVFEKGTSTGSRLGFAPASPAKIAGMLVDELDTLEVWIPAKDAPAIQPPGSQRADNGTWVAAPRARLPLKVERRPPNHH